MFVRRDAPDLSNPVEGKDYTVTGLIGTDKLDGTVTLSYSGLDVNKVGTADIIARDRIVAECRAVRALFL